LSVWHRLGAQIASFGAARQRPRRTEADVHIGGHAFFQKDVSRLAIGTTMGAPRCMNMRPF
jgi:hypothetical protein